MPVLESHFIVASVVGRMKRVHSYEPFLAIPWPRVTQKLHRCRRWWSLSIVVVGGCRRLSSLVVVVDRPWWSLSIIVVGGCCRLSSLVVVVNRRRWLS